MEVIDGVAAELKEKLVPPPQLPPSSRGGEGWFSYESVSSDRWWRGIVVRILGWLLGGSPLSAWIDSPFFKILEIVGAILFWLLRRSLSTVTVSFFSVLIPLYPLPNSYRASPVGACWLLNLRGLVRALSLYVFLVASTFNESSVHPSRQVVIRRRYQR
ncbi:hypothetical protein GYMLUDRAFT_617766 [Collybiopsis luxurians FD-317 M1]|uniref:Uncharacterized protein n=1 Tax=Collybiopsis luxurians FD-317 M1 TaxID=944289 RepID=A0A0D0CVJ4_9AGAR|nr:hypothetical protein GYMLUDRAFT_617766 [Collybiopsis luxurians FD-317 M1]